jgi:hypothetical protein
MYPQHNNKRERERSSNPAFGDAVIDKHEFLGPVTACVAVGRLLTPLGLTGVGGGR